MANFSSACHHDVEVSIHEFPVIYGAVWDPCDADNIGHSLYNISLKNGLQSQFVVKTSLVACSLVVKTCDLKACTNLYESSGHFHAWRSTFRSFLVGHIYIMQEMNANSTTLSSVSGITSLGHNWHVHELPLQTEADSCTSAGSHFNPFNVPTGGRRHMALTFQANSTVRYFFTDTSSSLAGPTSIIGKSLVIHVANGGKGGLGEMLWGRGL
uniref:Superoxide dismutase copper/zinc binding domain-containing protein n=1 Tax=Leptobrachium leishanense TaxID=445787 RepID=A0A8C5QCF4_9ANUR